MPTLKLHSDARSDLESIYREDRAASARLLAMLQQIAADPDLMDRLTQHDYGAYETQTFHVSRWQGQWQKGKNLWRLKNWDLEAQGLRYRVIYAFRPRQQEHIILGIVPRDFNYDSNHPVSQRIFTAYDHLI